MNTHLISRKSDVILLWRTLLFIAFLLCSTPVVSQIVMKDTITLSDLKKVARTDIDRVNVTDHVAEILLKDARQLLAKRAIFTEYLRFLDRLENGGAEYRDPYDKLFTKLEYEAAFPGGMDAWRAYLSNNLRYPTIAMERKIQGTVAFTSNGIANS
jgi:hypothetical protein